MDSTWRRSGDTTSCPKKHKKVEKGIGCIGVTVCYSVYCMRIYIYTRYEYAYIYNFKTLYYTYMYIYIPNPKQGWLVISHIRSACFEETHVIEIKEMLRMLGEDVSMSQSRKKYDIHTRRKTQCHKPFLDIHHMWEHLNSDPPFL